MQIHMRIHLLGAALLLLASAAAAQDNPVAMQTGAHLETVCSDRAANSGRQFVCLSWLNGAAQGNGWFEPRDPAQTPPYCPPTRNFNPAVHRDIILKWLKAHPAARSSPAMVVRAQALAAKWPCKR